MNITEQGGIKSPVPGTQAIIDALRGSRRFSISPIDHSDQNGSLLGHYRVSANTGTYVATGAGTFFAAARWTDNHSFMVPLLLKVSAVTVNAATALPFTVEALSVRSYTGVVTTTSTSIVPFAATGSNRNRSTMGSPLLANFQISTTSNLAAQTWVTDSQGFGNGLFDGGVATVGMASKPVELYKYDVLGQHPLVYGVNEGWALRFQHAAPTNWSGTIFITFEWAEVAAY